MVSWSILWEHAAALALVWAWVALAGFALLPILRLRVGLVGVPLLGIVFWTLALYLLPIARGLDMAAALIVCLALWAGVRGGWAPIWKRWSWATLILVVGSLPYLTTLLFHYVPFGMDGSMHATAATLIARHGGLPATHAPFAPDLTFPPMNLGLPAVAALAIRWGAEPAAAMLACHHLTFTALILATYLLLRCWTGRPSAALLAVLSVWSARASQASLEWGGFPTVLSVAVGLFAARLLVQHIRSSGGRLSLGTGGAIAAIPLIHGVGGGTWLYCVGPSVVLACWIQTRARKAYLLELGQTFIFAGVMLCIYRAAGPLDVQTRDLEVTHDWQQQSVHLGRHAYLSAFEYIRKDTGSTIVIAGWAACGVLLLRRQWLAASILTMSWLMLALVVANSRWWVLPASFLLYPERAIYWAAPLSAVALAIAWRSVTSHVRHQGSERTSWPALRPAAVAAVLGLLTVAALQHNLYYQKIVRADFVNADGWEALLWARQNLQPARDFVETSYGSTGSFLPAVAQIGCSGAHHHHFLATEVQAMHRRRAATHVLVDQTRAPEAKLPAGTVVFRNRSITIVALGHQQTAAAPRTAGGAAK